MTNLNEDDIGELKSVKYRIKAILEDPNPKGYQYWQVMQLIEKLSARLQKEGKMSDQIEPYLGELDDIKLLTERFVNIFCEMMEHD